MPPTGVYIAFEHSEWVVRAVSDCTVVLWHLDYLNYLATRCSPAVSAFWRNFALCQVGGGVLACSCGM